VRRYYANFSYRAASWAKARRVVVFYNQRGTAEQWIKEGKHAIRWTVLSQVRSQCCPSPVARTRLQSWEFSANLGPARRRAALVADDARGQAHQDWRQDRPPRALRYFPDGRGRNPARPVRRYTEPH
jgi:hypothetical protein